MRSIRMFIGAATLVTAAAAPAQTPPAPAPDKMQEIVCRKDKETGSLVKTKKTCHSRAQWAFIDDENQRFSRNLVDETRSKPGGGN